MFARASALSLLALPLFAAANAVPRGGGGGYGPSNQCNTGDIQCCNQVGTAKTLAANNVGSVIGSLLNAVVGPVTAIVAVQCTPLSVLAIAGHSCTAQPVCCTDNQFNGLVNVGCSPVNLNL